MAVHIALLRGINVGRHQRVAMADLRAMLTDLGFGQARSLLQSGNLVFHGSARAGPEIEALLEREAATRLGLRTDFLVRSAGEWAEILSANPFPEEAEHDPGHLVVMFLKEVPDGSVAAALQAAATGPERLRVIGRHVYIVCPNGIGRSRLKLDVLGTTRNWNTVRKLGALANG